MTQDDLKLVLEALKWCHGGEPCGTAEAIAVVEKALAQEQEPVAWYYPDGSPDQCTTDKAYAEMEPAWIPLYAAPHKAKP